jgi:hypothetical protein
MEDERCSPRRRQSGFCGVAATTPGQCRNGQRDPGISDLPAGSPDGQTAIVASCEFAAFETQAFFALANSGGRIWFLRDFRPGRPCTVSVIRISRAFNPASVVNAANSPTGPCIADRLIAESNRRTRAVPVHHQSASRCFRIRVSGPAMSLRIFGSSDMPRPPSRLPHAEPGFVGRIVNSLLGLVLIGHLALRSRRKRKSQLTSASRSPRRH